MLAETLLEYETLTGDEVRDIVLRGKKPNRPAVNSDSGALGDQSVFKKKEEKAENKQRGGLAGLADKVRPRKGVKEDKQ